MWMDIVQWKTYFSARLEVLFAALYISITWAKTKCLLKTFVFYWWYHLKGGMLKPKCPFSSRPLLLSPPKRGNLSSQYQICANLDIGCFNLFQKSGTSPIFCVSGQYLILNYRYSTKVLCIRKSIKRDCKSVFLKEIWITFITLVASRSLRNWSRILCSSCTSFLWLSLCPWACIGSD